ncbi:MAG: 1,4-dihydroxy-2-naphthoate polyprenyltransferase [Actinobacteria bacterium]|nr:1,4-dihydroxy-2-naphthoate polyprenyltransferase [Actinomycetota bacterium]
MNKWIEGARPKTLPASIVPVLVGTAAAHHALLRSRFEHGGLMYLYEGEPTIVWRFGAALIVSVAIQIAVNYANDYFDGRKGVDTAARVGPLRLTASGLATHKQMKIAIATGLGAAAIAGFALAAATSWWLLGMGALAFVAALGYSGGPRPYASAGLGELFVFIFFGLVATVGSAYVQIETVTRLAVISAIPIGFIAVAILVVNNLRDINTDAAAGKITLAVRFGPKRTRLFFRLLIALAFVMLVPIALIAHSAWPLLALLALNFAVKPTMLVGEEAPPKLVGALITTARLHLIFGTLLAIGLWVR